MPDFFLTEHPTLSPTQCVFCLSATDPGGFVDGEMELRPYGNLYVCATCAKQIGNRFGMVSSEEAGELDDRIKELTAQLAAAEGELQLARDHVVVSRSELRAFIDETKTKPAATVPPGKRERQATRAKAASR